MTPLRRFFSPAALTLQPRRTWDRALYVGDLSRPELDRLWIAGALPITIADAMDVGEAIAVVRDLPPVDRPGDAAPGGYGLLPPSGAEPYLRIARAARDYAGRVIEPRTRGLIGAMWRDPGAVHATLRVWFRSDSGSDLDIRFVDIREDMIGSIEGLERMIPHLTGWEIARLDGRAPDGAASLHTPDGSA